MRVGRHAVLCAEHKIITRYNDITLLQNHGNDLWVSVHCVEKNLFSFFFFSFFSRSLSTPCLCVRVLGLHHCTNPFQSAIEVDTRIYDTQFCYNFTRYKFQFTFSFCFDVPIPFCVAHRYYKWDFTVWYVPCVWYVWSGERQQKGHPPSESRQLFYNYDRNENLFVSHFFSVHLFTWKRGTAVRIRKKMRKAS